jgi:hypothetical protein
LNIRSLNLWQATTEEDLYLEARDRLGDGSENRTEVTIAGWGEDKDRARDNGEDDDKGRGENVDRIFIQVK